MNCVSVTFPIPGVHRRPVVKRSIPRVGNKRWYQRMVIHGHFQQRIVRINEIRSKLKRQLNSPAHWDLDRALLMALAEAKNAVLVLSIDSGYSDSAVGKLIDDSGLVSSRENPWRG